MKITVTLTLEQSDDLDQHDVWPDGDMPESPNVEDVIAQMAQSGSVANVLRDWNLTPESIHIYLTATADNGEVLYSSVGEYTG